MKAKAFENICAQGDVLIRKVSAIPDTAQPVAPENGAVIVTHSETGHHHTMVLDRKSKTPNVEMFQDPENALLAWIKVNRPTVLEHQRPHDTHAPIKFAKGTYEIRRQREYTPEGWRRVAD